MDKIAMSPVNLDKIDYDMVKNLIAQEESRAPTSNFVAAFGGRGESVLDILQILFRRSLWAGVSLGPRDRAGTID